MSAVENKKVFAEPTCEVVKFMVEDVVTTSDWAGGIMPLDMYEDEE